MHMFAAAAGLTAVFMAVPMAYETAQVVRRGLSAVAGVAGHPARARARLSRSARIAGDSPARLFVMGFMTNALNPKIAVFYLSVFPQFVRPEHGSVFAQSVVLGLHPDRG